MTLLNLKWKKQGKNRSRPAIRPGGREGVIPRRNKRRSSRIKPFLGSAWPARVFGYPCWESRVNASWYFWAVFSMTADGRWGAGGVLSQSSVSR
jgi:hypothetical protein